MTLYLLVKYLQVLGEIVLMRMALLTLDNR